MAETPVEIVNRFVTNEALFHAFMTGPATGDGSMIDPGGDANPFPTRAKLIADFPTESEQVVTIMAAIAALAANAAVKPKPYQTKAAMDADLAHVADEYALVWNDATDANNRLYIKTGASGAGAWNVVKDRADIAVAAEAVLRTDGDTETLRRIGDLPAARVFGHKPVGQRLSDTFGFDIASNLLCDCSGTVIGKDVPANKLIDTIWRPRQLPAAAMSDRTKVWLRPSGSVHANQGPSVANGDILWDTITIIKQATITAYCATTQSLVLSGEQTIDGKLTNASIVLMMDNSPNAGLWQTAAGAWSRLAAADTAAELGSITVTVSGGEVYCNRSFQCDQATADITINTTIITFHEIQTFASVGIVLGAASFVMVPYFLNLPFRKPAGWTFFAETATLDGNGTEIVSGFAKNSVMGLPADQMGYTRVAVGGAWNTHGSGASVWQADTPASFDSEEAALVWETQALDVTSGYYSMANGTFQASNNAKHALYAVRPGDRRMRAEGWVQSDGWSLVQFFDRKMRLIGIAGQGAAAGTLYDATNPLVINRPPSCTSVGLSVYTGTGRPAPVLKVERPIALGTKVQDHETRVTALETKTVNVLGRHAGHTILWNGNSTAEGVVAALGGKGAPALTVESVGGLLINKAKGASIWRLGVHQYRTDHLVEPDHPTYDAYGWTGVSWYAVLVSRCKLLAEAHDFNNNWESKWYNLTADDPNLGPRPLHLTDQMSGILAGVNLVQLCLDCTIEAWFDAYLPILHTFVADNVRNDCYDDIRAYPEEWNATHGTNYGLEDRTFLLGSMRFLYNRLRNYDLRKRMAMIGPYEKWDPRFIYQEPAMTKFANDVKIPICLLADKLQWTQELVTMSKQWVDGILVDGPPIQKMVCDWHLADGTHPASTKDGSACIDISHVTIPFAMNEMI